VKILALDTATENCSVALLIDRTLVARERLLERGHAAQILPMIDEVLAEAGIALQAVDAIAFGRGPGGFTGVRLAASVTQGLAFGVGVPVVPVSNLRALAQRLLAADASVEHVVVCTDARMEEVYWGCFERRDGLAALVGEEQLGVPEGVRLPPGWLGNDHAHASRFGAGRGFAAYPQLAAAMRPLLRGIREDLLPRAAEIAVLAVPEIGAGRIFPAEQALPIYLRNDVVRAGGGQSLK
jgi:tRNA threonylcarbamoyladenosine biosynthesis protein TsaB